MKSVEHQQKKDQLIIYRKNFEDAIQDTYCSVPKDEIFQEMVPQEKILQLGEFITGFHHKIEEMEANLVRNTAPKVN